MIYINMLIIRSAFLIKVESPLRNVKNANDFVECLIVET